MDNDIFIVMDDIVGQEYQDFLQAQVEGTILPLYYNPVTVYFIDEQFNDPKQKDAPQFTHSFLRENGSMSDYFNLLNPLMSSLYARLDNASNFKLVKSKLNLNYTMPNYADDEHFFAHVDVPPNMNGLTGIYYVNDCDGDTLFFGEDRKTVVKRFSPKKGSCILFDNNIYHAGQPPRVSAYKSVINFNLLKQ